MPMRSLPIVSLLLAFGAIAVQWSPLPLTTAAIDQVRQRFEHDLGAWATQTRELAAVLADTASTAAERRGAHLRTRLAYKRVEWLAAYFDEAAVRRFVNGAPLPGVERHVAELRVLTPLGLQPLEELLYAPADGASAPLHHRRLDTLAAQLAAATPRIARELSRRRPGHADVFAAARYGLVRVFTLGVTGFDTPASGAALRESYVALEALRDGVAPLLAVLPQGPPTAVATDRLRADVEAAFATGLARLDTSDFDGFDRLAFLTECIDPLYDLLLTAHHRCGAELPTDRATAVPAHDYRSRSLFDDGFLNDDYFAGQPADDPLFARKRDLGERLFYDASLSAGGAMSCASCHDPRRAFTDGETRSLGNDGRPLRRNAPTLVGAVYAERYFADLREPRLARQIRHVVQDEHEFATDYLTLLEGLRQNPAYAAAFDGAYADVAPAYRISTHSLSDALASYVRTLHAHASPVDRYIRGETAALAPEVRAGFNLFMGKAACATCHFAPTFAGLVPPFYRESESEVLGVPHEWPLTDTTHLDADPGRAGSGQPLDGAPFYVGSFKTPTVRNAARTAPYMHNGALETLGDVVDFYDRGGGAGLGFRVPYQTLPSDALSLDAPEREALVAFVTALTDAPPP